MILLSDFIQDFIKNKKSKELYSLTRFSLKVLWIFTPFKGFSCFFILPKERVEKSGSRAPRRTPIKEYFSEQIQGTVPGCHHRATHFGEQMFEQMPAIIRTESTGHHPSVRP